MLALCLTACSSAPMSENESVTKETNSSYPDKPIKITAPSGARGGLDTTARAVTKVLLDTGLESQTMTIENKPGGGQAVGVADFVSQDSKDPYRLYLPSVPLIINNLKKEGNSPYSYNDLTPLAQLTKDYGAIVVPIDSKYNDLKTLFEDLKANPEEITLAGGFSSRFAGSSCCNVTCCKSRGRSEQNKICLL